MYFSNVYSMTDENTENAENTEDTTTAEKGVWAYLVIVEKGSSLTVEDAKAQISLIEAETITSLDQNFNVNMSSSKNVDINDAQLVFDMYNSLYDNFNTVTMQKFLYADVNTDTVVNSLDAQMVVYSIVNTVSTN